MFYKLKHKAYQLLRWSERYTKTDMVYFASSNFWLNLSRFVSIGTGMTLTVAFANFLTPEVFGTYKYVLAAAGLIGAFSLHGLMMSLARAVAQGKLHIIPTVVKSAMLWSIPASIAALAVSIYYFVQGNSDLGFAFLFIAASNSLSNGIGITKSVWHAAGEFRMATVAGIPKIVVPFIVILFTILITKDVVWILLAYFASNLLVSWLGYKFMLWWLRVHPSSEGAGETINYGKKLSLIGAFQIASGQIDQLLLWHFTTPVTLATYALALSPINEAQNFLYNFLSPFFNKIAKKSKAEAYDTVPFRLKQMFFASAVVTLIYITAVPFLFMLLFPKYMASVLVSQVLALTLLFQPRGLIDTLFTAHAEVRKRSQAILLSQVVKFGLLIALIPTFGLWGAVAALLLSDATAALIYYIAYRRSRTVI